MEFGAGIKINGDRPDWLEDDVYVRVLWSDGAWAGPYPSQCIHGWPASIDTIRLPVDHWYYKPIKVGDWVVALKDDMDIRKGGVYKVVTSDSMFISFDDDAGDNRVRGKSEYRPASPSEIPQGERKYTEKEAIYLGLDISTLKHLGLFIEKTNVEKFEDWHEGLSDTQRDILEIYQDWLDNQN